MAAPENPFTNLDVSCKWTGDPISDVDVSVSVDVSELSYNAHFV
jgi:hypothetical protein